MAGSNERATVEDIMAEWDAIDDEYSDTAEQTTLPDPPYSLNALDRLTTADDSALVNQPTTLSPSSCFLEFFDTFITVDDFDLFDKSAALPDLPTDKDVFEEFTTADDFVPAKQSTTTTSIESLSYEMSNYEPGAPMAETLSNADNGTTEPTTNAESRSLVSKEALDDRDALDIELFGTTFQADTGVTELITNLGPHSPASEETSYDQDALDKELFGTTFEADTGVTEPIINNESHSLASEDVSYDQDALDKELFGITFGTDTGVTEPVTTTESHFPVSEGTSYDQDALDQELFGTAFEAGTDVAKPVTNIKSYSPVAGETAHNPSLDQVNFGTLTQFKANNDIAGTVGVLGKPNPTSLPLSTLSSRDNVVTTQHLTDFEEYVRKHVFDFNNDYQANIMPDNPANAMPPSWNSPGASVEQFQFNDSGDYSESFQTNSHHVPATPNQNPNNSSYAVPASGIEMSQGDSFQMSTLPRQLVNDTPYMPAQLQKLQPLPEVYSDTHMSLESLQQNAITGSPIAALPQVMPLTDDQHQMQYFSPSCVQSTINGPSASTQPQMMWTSQQEYQAYPFSATPDQGALYNSAMPPLQQTIPQMTPLPHNQYQANALPITKQGDMNGPSVMARPHVTPSQQRPGVNLSPSFGQGQFDYSTMPPMPHTVPKTAKQAQRMSNMTSPLEEQIQMHSSSTLSHQGSINSLYTPANVGRAQTTGAYTSGNEAYPPVNEAYIAVEEEYAPPTGNALPTVAYTSAFSTPEKTSGHRDSDSKASCTPPGRTEQSTTRKRGRNSFSSGSPVKRARPNPSMTAQPQGSAIGGQKGPISHIFGENSSPEERLIMQQIVLDNDTSDGGRSVAELLKLRFSTLNVREKAKLLLPIFQGQHPLEAERLARIYGASYGAMRQREALKKAIELRREAGQQ